MTNTPITDSFLAMFPQLRHSTHVEEHYVQMADHTFIIEADRVELTKRMKSWFAKSAFLRVACDESVENDDRCLQEPISGSS